MLVNGKGGGGYLEVDCDGVLANVIRAGLDYADSVV